MVSFTTAEVAGLQDLLFDTTITVLGVGAGRRYTQVLPGGEAIPARFERLTSAGPTAADRAELASLRELRWDPAWVMPETAVIKDVAGRQWNLRAKTFGETAVYRYADVERV